jgi:kinesin family protein C2/C3
MLLLIQKFSSAGGHAKTLMFVQINPDVSSYSETLSTLKFAERVSGVELGAAKANKEGKDIREFMEQVRKLYFPFAHLFAICTREVDY